MLRICIHFRIFLKQTVCMHVYVQVHVCHFLMFCMISVWFLGFAFLLFKDFNLVHVSCSIFRGLFMFFIVTVTSFSNYVYLIIRFIYIYMIFIVNSMIFNDNIYFIIYFCMIFSLFRYCLVKISFFYNSSCVCPFAHVSYGKIW